MRCTECHGRGVFGTINSDGEYGPLFPRALPCPECGGTGHLHCCEGLREQPETEKDCEDGHR